MRILFVLLFLLTGCAGTPVDQNRAGCSYIDGKARYGSFTQYIKGNADGAYIYVGDNLLGKVTISCDADIQRVDVYAE